MLTQQRLREVLDYDETTGLFRWRYQSSPKIKIGNIAGQTDRHGYRLINVDCRRYIASRLVFLYMTGRFPDHDIDHSDGNRANDRWPNLREATTTQNMQNKRIQRNNKCGLKGVFLMKHVRPTNRNKWRARIKTNEKHIHLGVFDCPAAAHFTYIIAADKYFGEFARPQ